MGSEREYVYAWGAGPFGPNPVRAARKGQPCRLLVVATRMGSVLVEFTDGFRMVTSRRALRRRRAGDGTP